MGNDARAAPRCRDAAPPLFSYFKQRFAQVTNPAIDSIREDAGDEPDDAGSGPGGNAARGDAPTHVPPAAARRARS